MTIPAQPADGPFSCTYLSSIPKTRTSTDASRRKSPLILAQLCRSSAIGRGAYAPGPARRKRADRWIAEKGAVAASLVPIFEARNRKKLAEAGKEGGRGNKKGRDELTLGFQNDSKRSTAQAAKTAGDRGKQGGRGQEKLWG